MKEGQPTSHFLIDPYALAGNRFVWLVVVVVRFIAILYCWHGINTLGLFNLQPRTLHIEFAGSPVILHTIGIYRKNEYWIASQKVCGESKSDYRKAPLSTVYGIFRCCHCGVRDLKVCQYLGCFFQRTSFNGARWNELSKASPFNGCILSYCPTRPFHTK